MKYFKTACLFAISCVSATNNGPVIIKEDGVDVTRYVVSDNAQISTDGRSITLQHNARGHIASAANDELTAENYHQYSLLNKSLSFDVDLGDKVACSCNAAFYALQMPGVDRNGNPSPGEFGSYYCDAMCNGGNCCWDMDIMEGNQYVSQYTAHKCFDPAGGFINSCDTIGCGGSTTDVYTNAVCPHESCKIDSSKPYTQKTTFYESTIEVELTSSVDGAQVSWSVCKDEDYKKSMADAFDQGLVLTMSVWGGDYNTMKWLDGDVCPETSYCDPTSSVTYSNIIIEDAVKSSTIKWIQN